MAEDFKLLINLTSQNMNSCELNLYVFLLSNDEILLLVIISYFVSICILFLLIYTFVLVFVCAFIVVCSRR